MNSPSRKQTPDPTRASELDALVARCRGNLKAGRGLLDGLDPAEVEAVQTRYASFNDILDPQGFLTASEVVLKTPLTPRPFVHILATSHTAFGQWATFWDQHCGGFSALDSVGRGG